MEICKDYLINKYKTFHFKTKTKIYQDVEGNCVRDMHAEALSRRGFVRFLYEIFHPGLSMLWPVAWHFLA